MPKVLIAGLPGTGKGILFSILYRSPDLDCLFASWPNKGDHDPTEYDYVIRTERDETKQLVSLRRKSALTMSEAEAEAVNAEGVRQLADIKPTHVWHYRQTVETPVDKIIDYWANELDVPTWSYDGPDIYDGDR